MNICSVAFFATSRIVIVTAINHQPQVASEHQGTWYFLVDGYAGRLHTEILSKHPRGTFFAA